MSDRPIFDLKKSTFEKLKKWQQKMEEKNRAEAEAEKKPQTEIFNKTKN